MYADIVVLTYQAPEVQTFTYKIPKELENKVKIGQLVSVPFGKRTPNGVILGISHQLPKTRDQLLTTGIKPITAILLETPILLPYQIELLKWMSFYYHAPMVNCLEAMLPDIPEKLPVTSYQKPDTIHQTLVLVPSINRLPETLAMYPHAKDHVIYHAEQKIAERFDNWLKILSGNADYIFGSRSAIFAPCPNLKKIIIYDEHDGAYKDERSPYYDTLTIAEKINQFTGAEIKIIDSAPRITTYFVHKTEIYSSSQRSESRSYLSSTRHPELDSGSRFRNKFGMTEGEMVSSRQARTIIRVPSPKVKIVSMLDEKAAGNKSPISDILTEYLKAAAIKQKSVLLFLNKKIESGHIYCRSCKHNEFAAKQPETCPSCHSPDIWFNSLNISSLADLVRKIVPEVKITLIAEGLKDLTIVNRQSTIDIGTASVLYKLLPRKYDLVAHVATDTALNISDITSAEKVWEQITDLKRLTRGLLLLQTYNPNHLAIKTAAAGEYRKFYENQLSERKALTFPPFSLLVKLILRGKDENLVEEQAQRLYEELSDQLSNYPTTQLPTILGPYKPFFSKAPRYNIILKIPIPDYNLDSRQTELEKMQPYFSQIPKKWQIVIEPDSIN